MNSVELFTGAGGLALGIEQAGFRHLALIERDADSCQTLEANSRLFGSPWPVHHTPVEDFDYRQMPTAVDLLAGGPPCQPFSIGGKHIGTHDHRNMFPQMFRAIRELQPRAVLIENVKGLTRASFRDYFDYILLQLAFPTVVARPDEQWVEHKLRLQRDAPHYHHDLCYTISYKLVDCVDYGIPQRRQRVFIVGFRSDLEVQWAWPEPTHSEAALLFAQWIDGSYWRKHTIQQPSFPDALRSKVARLEHLPSLANTARWQTVRDALSGLPDPEHEIDSNLVHNHLFIPGARSYKGHTGSPYDWPAKTLKAGDHGVPGGENTLAFADGSVRYFTVRESARLQTFPDTYFFPGSRTESMRQLGNAVPVQMAYIIASQIGQALEQTARSPRRSALEMAANVVPQQLAMPLEVGQ